jgi:mRNA interferase MazF
VVDPGIALRGEVWLCAIPAAVGPHPVLILTTNRVAASLSAVAVALITGTPGPSTTHVPIGRDAGLTRYDESVVNCTDLHTVAKPRLRKRLGLVAPAELRRVEDCLRLALGLQR